MVEDGGGSGGPGGLINGLHIQFKMGQLSPYKDINFLCL